MTAEAWRALAVLVGAFLAFQLMASAWFPFAKCRWGCEGGRVFNKRRTAWRNCFRCGGKGRRTRWGRKWWEMVRGER